ncbi:MAG: hypothetical protein ACRC3A_04395 [Culicoidibacterales bacterium]
MNYFTPEETDEILATVRAAAGSASLVEWQYWYRAASYETFEHWGIDRQAIQEVLKMVTADDVVTTELQHGNRKSLVFVLFPWLLPTVGVDAFAYMKIALQFDNHNQLKTITVLSFKEANETEHLAFPIDLGYSQFFEWNRSTWLESKPELLVTMKPENRTTALFILALAMNPQVAKALPRTVFTSELVNALCRHDPTILFYLPTAFWEEWRLRLALQRDWRSIALVPKVKLTAQLVHDICLHHPETLLLVPTHLWNPSLVRRAIEQQPTLIQDIPDEYLTPTLVDLACQFEPTVIYSLPYRFWLESYVMRAVEIDPLGLEIAPVALLTPALVEAAIACDPSVVAVLPPALLTPSRLLQVVASYPKAAKLFTGTWTKALAQQVADLNSVAVFDLPAQLLPVETYVSLTYADVRYFVTVPKAAITAELVDFVVAAQPELLAIVPKEFKTTQLCLKAVQAQADVWQYVPKHIKSRIQVMGVHA